MDVTEAGRMQLRDEYRERVHSAVRKQMCDQMSDEKFVEYIKSLNKKGLEDLCMVLHAERQQLADAVLEVK